MTQGAAGGGPGSPSAFLVRIVQSKQEFLDISLI